MREGVSRNGCRRSERDGLGLAGTASLRAAPAKSEIWISDLYKPRQGVPLLLAMSSMLRLSSLVLLGTMLVGCKTTFTNLTPSKQPRNPTGMYPVEVEWDSTQSTIRVDSIKALAEVDLNTYPMRPTLGISNRWETVIPVPAGKNTVFYRFKVDYDYNRFGRPGQDSVRSASYRLDIVDK